MKRAILWVTGIVFVGKVLFAMANNSQGVLLSDFITAFSLTSSWQGVPNAAANVGVMTAMLCSVPLSERMGKLWLYASALALMGLMLLAAGSASSALMLTAAYGVMGFGFGSIDTTASSIVADLHRGPRASQMMGLLHAAYGTGGILAPIVLSSALEMGGTWRTVLYGLSAAMFVVFVLCVVVFRANAPHLPVQAQQKRKTSKKEIVAYLKKSGNVMIMLCTAGYCAHQVSIYLWIKRVISEGLGNPELGVAALSLFWVGTVISRLAVPMLRIGAVRYVKISMLMTTVLQIVSALIGSPLVVCIVTALTGLLGGATIPMMLAEITRRNPEESMLSVTSVLLTTGAMAIVCAPLIGYIVHVTGSLLAVVYVSAGFGLLCSLFGFRVPNHSETEQVL